MLANRIARPRNRHGFTLVEMLVAIAVLLILFAITAAAWQGISSGDSVKGAAESIKSHLHGAMNRATFYTRNVGVRLVLDDADRTTATGLIYLLQPEPYSEGTIAITTDASGQFRIVTGSGTQWHSLMRRQMIRGPQTVLLLDGIPYTFTTEMLGPGSEVLHLTKEYAGGATGTTPKYSLLLQPVVMPNQEPVRLPRGVAIDLDSSIVPLNWQNAAGDYVTELDIVFSPRGDVQRGMTGSLGPKVLTDSVIQSGRITLVLASIEDITLGNGVEVIDRKGPQHLVCVQESNAKIYSCPVSTTDANGNGRADDPFEFAETGESVSF